MASRTPGPCRTALSPRKHSATAYTSSAASTPRNSGISSTSSSAYSTPRRHVRPYNAQRTFGSPEKATKRPAYSPARASPRRPDGHNAANGSWMNQTVLDDAAWMSEKIQNLQKTGFLRYPAASKLRRFNTQNSQTSEHSLDPSESDTCMEGASFDRHPTVSDQISASSHDHRDTAASLGDRPSVSSRGFQPAGTFDSTVEEPLSAFRLNEISLGEDDLLTDISSPTSTFGGSNSCFTHDYAQNPPEQKTLPEAAQTVNNSDAPTSKLEQQPLHTFKLPNSTTARNLVSEKLLSRLEALQLRAGLSHKEETNIHFQKTYPHQQSNSFARGAANGNLFQTAMSVPDTTKQSQFSSWSEQPDQSNDTGWIASLHDQVNNALKEQCMQYTSGKKIRPEYYLPLSSEEPMSDVKETEDHKDDSFRIMRMQRPASPLRQQQEEIRNIKVSSPRVLINQTSFANTAPSSPSTLYASLTSPKRISRTASKKPRAGKSRSPVGIQHKPILPKENAIRRENNLLRSSGDAETKEECDVENSWICDENVETFLYGRPLLTDNIGSKLEALALNDDIQSTELSKKNISQQVTSASYQRELHSESENNPSDNQALMKERIENLIGSYLDSKFVAPVEMTKKQTSDSTTSVADKNELDGETKEEDSSEKGPLRSLIAAVDAAIVRTLDPTTYYVSADKKLQNPEDSHNKQVNDGGHMSDKCQFWTPQPNASAAVTDENKIHSHREGLSEHKAMPRSIVRSLSFTNQETTVSVAMKENSENYSDDKSNATANDSQKDEIIKPTKPENSQERGFASSGRHMFAEILKSVESDKRIISADDKHHKSDNFYTDQNESKANELHQWIMPEAHLLEETLVPDDSDIRGKDDVPSGTGDAEPTENSHTWNDLEELPHGQPEFETEDVSSFKLFENKYASIDMSNFSDTASDGNTTEQEDRQAAPYNHCAPEAASSEDRLEEVLHNHISNEDQCIGTPEQAFKGTRTSPEPMLSIYKNPLWMDENGTDCDKTEDTHNRVMLDLPRISDLDSHKLSFPKRSLDDVWNTYEGVGGLLSPAGDSNSPRSEDGHSSGELNSLWGVDGLTVSENHDEKDRDVPMWNGNDHDLSVTENLEHIDSHNTQPQLLLPGEISEPDSHRSGFYLLNERTVPQANPNEDIQEKDFLVPESVQYGEDSELCSKQMHNRQLVPYIQVNSLKSEVAEQGPPLDSNNSVEAREEVKQVTFIFPESKDKKEERTIQTSMPELPLDNLSHWVFSFLSHVKDLRGPTKRKRKTDALMPNNTEQQAEINKIGRKVEALEAEIDKFKDENKKLQKLIKENEETAARLANEKKTWEQQRFNDMHIMDTHKDQQIQELKKMVMDLSSHVQELQIKVDAHNHQPLCVKETQIWSPYGKRNERTVRKPSSQLNNSQDNHVDSQKSQIPSAVNRKLQLSTPTKASALPHDTGSKLRMPSAVKKPK